MNRTLFASTLALSLAFASHVAAADFTIQSGLSSVSFTSNALLETITGTSSTVEGAVSVDTSDAGTATGNVSFPTASLRTGIDMRDEHLHSADWLDAESNPNITFQITSVDASGALTHGSTVSGSVTGQLTINGVAREVTAPVQVTYYAIDDPSVAGTYGIESDLLRITTAFDVNLADFGVSIMPPLRTKVAETINLSVRLTATAN